MRSEKPWKSTARSAPRPICRSSCWTLEQQAPPILDGAFNFVAETVNTVMNLWHKMMS
jgi:hypothetical protein